MMESGFVIFFAFWLLWIKVPIITRLKLLGHPLALDLTVSIAVWIMFGGTGAGLIAASLAALIMSVNISLARYLFGYYSKHNNEWYYHVGKINQADKISRYKRIKYAKKATAT